MATPRDMSLTAPPENPQEQPSESLVETRRETLAEVQKQAEQKEPGFFTKLWRKIPTWVKVGVGLGIGVGLLAMYLRNYHTQELLDTDQFRGEAFQGTAPLTPPTEIVGQQNPTVTGQSGPDGGVIRPTPQSQYGPNQITGQGVPGGNPP